MPRTIQAVAPWNPGRRKASAVSRGVFLSQTTGAFPSPALQNLAGLLAPLISLRPASCPKMKGSGAQQFRLPMTGPRDPHAGICAERGRADSFLNGAQVAAKLGIGRTTLDRRIAAGTFTRVLAHMLRLQ